MNGLDFFIGKGFYYSVELMGAVGIFGDIFGEEVNVGTVLAYAGVCIVGKYGSEGTSVLRRMDEGLLEREVVGK